MFQARLGTLSHRLSFPSSNSFMSKSLLSLEATCSCSGDLTVPELATQLNCVWKNHSIGDLQTCPSLCLGG